MIVNLLYIIKLVWKFSPDSSPLILPVQMIYSTFDVGNFLVIPSSLTEVWNADTLMTLDRDTLMTLEGEYLRSTMGYGREDVIILVVGSEFSYRGLWLEHSIILQALLPVLKDFSYKDFCLKIIVLSGNSNSNYSSAIEVLQNPHYTFSSIKVTFMLCIL